jgi:hypothetical protein
MLPKAHLAAGALVAAARSRGLGRRATARRIASYALAANLPDTDVFLPPLLDRFGPGRQVLGTTQHHAWPSHTPAFWLTLGLGIRQLPGGRGREAGELLLLGTGVHLLQDWTSDAIPLAWPLRRQRCGLRLGRFERIQPPPGRPEPQPVDVHPIASMRRWVSAQSEWMSLYAKTPAARIERALVVAAAAAVLWRLGRAQS